jgi:hypothetical protein
LRQAAAVLGVSESAIRKRVERGTLRSDKGPDGRRYVYLDTVADSMADIGADVSAIHERDVLTSERIEELRDEVHYLREQLRQELERRSAETERYQQIVAALTSANASLSERLREIESPQGTSLEARETPETATVAEKGAKNLENRAPGPPQLTPILGTLSAVVAGSIPWLQDVLEVNLNLSPPVTYVPLALFVLPFIFGLYRGDWNRRYQEFQEHAPKPTPAQQDGEAIGEEAVEPLRWGTREVNVAVLTAGGAALVAYVETLLRIEVIQAEWVPRSVFAIAWVFIVTLLFYFFALLIGAATGGQRSERDATPSETRGGSLSSSAWWNPQLFLSLLGTLITAIATVYAATLGG